jgi:ankyrin repeat protein
MNEGRHTGYRPTLPCLSAYPLLNAVRRPRYLAQGKGANVNEQSARGFTALLSGAENGHKDVVEFLVVRRVE